MFHAQISWNKKASEDGNGKRRMQAYQKKDITII